MQLCYRGIRYQSQTLNLPTVETGASAQFLGNQYPIRCAAIPLEIKDKSALVYRDILATQNFEGQFLGNSYSRSQLLIKVI